jgi:chromate transporter
MINPIAYFLIFLKGSLFSSGGLSNLPSIHQDLIGRKWAVEAQFGESLAIGQISPGPNGLWVISLGYLSYGFLGAFLALIAITLPPFFVLLVSSAYTRIEHQHWVPGLMRGISLAVIGISITVFWTIISGSGTDWHAWLLCLSAFLIALTKKVSVPLILVLAGIAGYLIYR